MRIHLELDDALLAQALRLTLRGQVHWRGDLDALRRLRRPGKA